MSFKKEFITFFKVYICSWILLFLLFLLNLFANGATFWGVVNRFWEIATSSAGFIFFHIVIVILYLLFLIIRYFSRVYQKRGFPILIKQLAFKLFLPVLVCYFSLKLIINSNASEQFDYQWNYSIENKTDRILNRYAIDQKQRGMTVYDLGRSNRTTTEELIQNNIEWVAIVPYFYQKNETTAQIQNRRVSNEWTSRDSVFFKSIKHLQSKQLKIHLKPHLWMSSGWRSNIHFDTKEDWNQWFGSYRHIILHYAKLAEKANVELFCLGTELRSAVKQVPEKWVTLINEIKSVYSGKLTYAANWDDYTHVPFWDELDYIGIQAYFPLTKNEDPTQKEIQLGWQKHIKELKRLASKHQKKVLFTEVGYRPTKNATTQPWEWGSFFTPLLEVKSEKVQYLAFEALFSTLWKEPWFAGTYIWQWNNSDFEIKGKPSQNSVAKWYATTE